MPKNPVKRSAKAKKQFLEKKGIKNPPKGKEVDHKKPLVDGGKDTPSNMQLMKKKAHADKTKREAKARAQKKKGK